MQVRDQNTWTIITTSEPAGRRGGGHAGVTGPLGGAAGSRPAGEVIALAGSTHRRGSVLVLVIGVLALLAIIVVVYTAIGQADSRAARQLSNKVVVTDTSKAVADHIAQVVANNGVSGFFQQDVASQQVRYSLQNWDYPSTDPEVRSVASSAGTGAPPAITNADEARSRLFDPTGTQRHRWFENGRVDPRESGDPWLASTEPVWLNQNGSTLTNPSDLVLRMQDWLHMSIIAPDGRAVNLANLRGNLLAGSGLGQINGAAGMTSRMLRVTPSNTPGGVPTFDLWTDSAVEVNTPSTWSSRGLGMFRQVRDTNGLAADQLSPGSPLNLNNSFADADGDGFYDSFWQELVDASDPRQPVNLLGSASGTGGLRVFVAPRIIDLSGLVNVNTATSFSDPFASREGSVPQNPAEPVLDPALPYFNPTGSATNFERAWRAAPVRMRTTFVTSGSLTDRDVLSTRANFIEAPPGLSPADVDLERLLTMLDTTRYLDRPQGFFGAVPGAYAPLDGQSVTDAFVPTGSPTALRAEMGGAAFSSLMFTRGTGATTVQDLLFAAVPTGQTALDGTIAYPQFVPGQTAFSTFESQRGVFRWAYGGGVALPPPPTATPTEIEAFNLQNALGTYRLFVTPMDRADLYRKLGAAEGVRFDREEAPAFGGGPFGGTGELGFSSVSRIGLTSERELRAFNGVNDPSITSALELVLDSRRDASGRGPLRSDRPLLQDRDLGVGTPAAVAARMTQYFAEPRRNLTTISGARPLTSFSVPYFDAQGSSGNQTVAPSLTINDQAVRLDVTEAVNRAQASSRRDAGNNLVQTGEVLSANRIFLAYAEALIPLADMQFSSGARVLGFDLWSSDENASARRTSATIFGAGAERPAPRQNTELALRIAAHMTMNMLAWRDDEDRPKAATLLLDGSIAGNVGSIVVDGVQAYPFWETGSAIANNRTALARYALNFNNPALRQDRNDLDRDGNTSEPMERLYDPSRTSLTDAPEAVNIFAVRPEPVITHVQSFTVYTDAIRVGTGDNSEVLSGRDFDDASEVQDLLLSLDNQFEVADSSVNINPPGDPIEPSDRIGNIKIDGRVRADNPDFILEMVAFQISNPTSSPIALSGIDPASGQALRAPQFTPEGRSGVFQADGTPINSWLDPFDVTQAASGGDPVTRESMSYYIEFAGRFYRLANYNWQPTGVNGDGTTNERSLQGQAVVLQPGESRVFYVLSQRPADISERIRQATGQTYSSREVVSWIESQLWQRLTLRRAPGSPGFQAGQPPEVVVPVGDGQENRPVMMVAVNRATGEVIDRNSGLTDALEASGREYGVGVLYPQAPDLRSNFTGRADVQLINQNPGSATPEVDNSSVRLWRVFRTGSEIGGNNQPQNDTLIDRLTDPIPGRDRFRSMTINGSLEQRIGMAGPDGSDDQRLGSIIRVANSQGSIDRTGDNTGLSVVMTGGFRRPDDPGAWVNLDDSGSPVFNYRGPGGGPVPAGFTNNFPRNAIPAWAVEVPPASSVNDVVSSVSTSNWWTRGLPDRTVATTDDRPEPTSGTPIERGRNTNYFLIGPANVASGASTPASDIDITDFEDTTFGIRPGSDAADVSRQRPLMLSRRMLGDVDALLQDASVTRFEVQGLQVNDQREIIQGTIRAAVPVVPALAAHPSEKFLQTELIRRSLRRSGAGDSDVGPRRGDANTLIDYSDLNVPSSGTDENVVTIQTTATGVIRPRFAEGTVPTGNDEDDRSFDRQYTIVPTYPRPLPSRQANQVGEEPIVPELRPADVLLPLAFGPSNTPRQFNGNQSRSQNLAQQWVTFSEAAGAALNYAAGDSNGSWNERIGQVLDRGRLPVNRFVAFNDDRGDLTVPVVPGVTSAVRQDLNGGIPLGAAVLDKFRTRSEGGATSPVLGTINVNTATHAALMMLPMFTAADFNRGNQQIAELHSWMTHGLTQSMTAPSFTASTNSPQQDGAMNSFGALSAQAGEVDSRSFLRGRPDSVWDVASTLMAYRDKNSVLSMPSFDGSNRYMLDFAEGNLGSIANASRFDDTARQDLTGIAGLREGRGLRSIGELMALRINPATGVTLRNPFTVANNTVVAGVDTPAEAQVSIDRFIRDNQPADYAFQRRGLQSGSNWVSLDSGAGRAFRVPLALTSMPALEQVDFGGLQPPRAVGVDASLNLLPGAARVDPTTFANLQSDTSVDSYEQGLIIANAALNSVNVRSDIFCAYFVIHGYQQSDVEGLSQVAGDATYEQPMVPTLKRRYMVVIDRSNVTRAGQKPRILMFQELPAE